MLSDQNFCAFLCEIQRTCFQRAADIVAKKEGPIHAFYMMMSAQWVFNTQYLDTFAISRHHKTYDGYRFGGVTMLKEDVTGEWNKMTDGPEGKADFPEIHPAAAPFRPDFTNRYNKQWCARRPV